MMLLALALGLGFAAPQGPGPGSGSALAERMTEAGIVWPELEASALEDLGVVLVMPESATYRERVGVLVTRVIMSARDFFGHKTPDLRANPWVVAVLPNKRAYERFARRHFEATSGVQGTRVPAYGFADPKARLIVIDHGPGEGTLAHELMHPLMEAAFPRAPAWLTEALPALYEHKAFEPLRFFPNWRRAQVRIREVSLRELFAADLTAVRSDDHRHLVGLGRHLLVFLFERGRLFEYYRALEVRLSRDPRRPDLASEEALAATWPDFESGAFTAELRSWLTARR